MADLKSKYKSTEIGAIPIDWELKTIGELGDLFKGKGISKSEILETGLPCIRYGELYTKYNTKFANTFSFCSEESASLSQAINKGDIVFAGSGETAEDIGKCAVYLGDEIAYAGGDTIILRPQNTDSIYLSYLLNYDSVVKQRSVLGQGNSVVHIYPKSIATILVQIPPLKEQIKIAKILSTWDNSIESLEQLIAKKERTKKALMQQLLTGKKRFKEFKGVKLKEYNLSEVTKLVRGPFGGALKKEIFVPSGYKVYEQKNAIYNDFKIGNYFIDDQKYNELKRFKIEPNDVIMSCSGTAGKLAIVPKDAQPGIINQALLKITVKPDFLITDYFIQFVNSPLFLNQLCVDLAGGAIKNVGSVSVLNKLKIIVPSLPEQKQIASVLSNADEELKALNEQLSIYKNQKQGLMQQLLTGKIRVKI